MVGQSDQDWSDETATLGLQVHSASGARELASTFDGATYTFMDIDEFGKLPVREMMYVYWTEMLFRAHLAAGASLIRGTAWMEALISAARARRVLPFAAAARGLLESSADANYSLNRVFTTLADNFEQIEVSLAKKQDKMWLAEELEQLLIHFVWATKTIPRAELPSATYAPKTTADYLEYFKDTPQVQGAYRDLCDYVHPGGSSVWSFMRGSDDAKTVQLSLDAESGTFELLQRTYCGIIDHVFIGAVNVPYIVLKTLNLFSLPEVRTPALDKINMDALPAWRTVKEKIRSRRRTGRR